MANAPRPLKVYDEGSLTHQGNEIDFVGSGVSVSSLSGKAVVTIDGGVTDHGALTGLSDSDDHSQYHNDSRALTWLGTRSTTDLAEGTNLYYTAARFNSAFAAKSTSDLAEGTNLYFTNARAVSALSGCNVSMFANDAGYLTGIGGCNLYDLANVGATAPSPANFLGWTGSAWDAMTPNIACLAGVSISTPTTGQVLKYNGSVWENGTISGGGVTFGNCYEIARMNVGGTDFCYNSGFVYDGVTFDVHVCGINDYTMYPRTERNGCIDTYYRANGACCEDQIFKFGFFDGETPYWGLDSAPCAASYMTNQYLRFTDYCTKWGNDDAYALISDIDNSIEMKFMCGFNISNSSSSWAIGYCSMEPNRVMINCQYYLPACGPTISGQVLGYCSMTGQPEWITGGGSGSPYGSQYEIQLNDGAGNFYATCNFLYDYSSYFLQMRHNGTSELLRFSNSSCCDYGWLIDVTNDTCGQGCHLTVRLGDDGMSNASRFRIDDYCNANNWIDFSPRNHMMRVNYYDGMCCYISEFGYDEANDSTVMRNCCFGKFEIGECNTDIMRWTFATYNDYIKAQDCIVSYGGCCNFQWKFNNGCNNGWNEWLSSGPAQGLVISSDDGCCMCRLVLAQGLVGRFELGADGFARVLSGTTLDICGGLCVAGTAPATDGTYSNPTSITIQCGIITAIS